MFSGILNLPKEWNSGQQFQKALSLLEGTSFQRKKKLANEYRALIGAEPVSTKEVVEEDFEKCTRSLALKIASQIFERQQGKDLEKEFLSVLKAKTPLKLSEKHQWIDETIDRMLGLNEFKIRKVLPPIPQEDLYLGSDPHDLFTPYRVIAEVLKYLPKKDFSFCDLGSGLGRVALTVKALRPTSQVYGVEILEKRCEQANHAVARLEWSNGISFICGNLRDVPIPPADVFFLFNPFSQKTLNFVFKKLMERNKEKAFTVVAVKVGRTFSFFKRVSAFELVQDVPIENWDGQGFQIYSVKPQPRPNR